MRGGFFVYWGKLKEVCHEYVGFCVVGRAFKASFTGTSSADPLKTGIAVFERGKTFALIWGVLATLIGQVIMLKNMDDPAGIGPGFGCAAAAACQRGLPLPLLLSGGHRSRRGIGGRCLSAGCAAGDELWGGRDGDGAG